MSFLNSFFFVYCGAKFVSRKALTFGAVHFGAAFLFYYDGRT